MHSSNSLYLSSISCNNHLWEMKIENGTKVLITGGASGIGKLNHGYNSFLAFSHARAIVSSPTWIDLPFKYPPFKFFAWIKKII